MRNLVTKPSRLFGRRSRFSFRALYLTVLIISLLAVVSLVADQTARYKLGSEYGIVQRRAVASLDITRPLKKDEECRLVHHADDKCAFIKANCPDEEAGLLSYLTLYYCDLAEAEAFAFGILVLWLGLLFSTIGIAASDFFCINLSTIASILRMSESLTGVTFLAFGNGSPDVFSTFAAMSTNSGSLAVGELIGAACFITAVVAGSMALVREFRVGRKTFVRDIGFFIVAASFSMVFLADGSLHLWECCAMIAFYIFYVIVVVMWHMFQGRRRRRKQREAAARGHVYVPGNEELEVTEENDDDDEGPADNQSSLLPHERSEDWDALERGGGSDSNDDSEGEDGEMRKFGVEMSNSMRVIRPRGSRSNTITPIRPSLLGALEFRSVLSSLQRSRSTMTPPIRLRRYSDDEASNNGHNNDIFSRSAHERSSNHINFADINSPDHSLRASPRARAVSMNDADKSRQPDPAAYSVATIPDIGVVAATPQRPSHLVVPSHDSNQASTSTDALTLSYPASPAFSITPPPSVTDSRIISAAPFMDRKSEEISTTQADNETGFTQYFDDPEDKHRFKSPVRPRLHIPPSHATTSAETSPIVKFPSYTDSPQPISAHSPRAPSMLLPDPAMTSESEYQMLDNEPTTPKIYAWWPYRFLPSPQILIATLFPTLYTWKDKSIWDKALSILSAPSIFLLSITLPVVEPDNKEAENVREESWDATSPVPRPKSRCSSSGVLVDVDGPSADQGGESEWQRYRRATSKLHSPSMRGLAGHGDAAEVAIATEEHHQHSQSSSHQERHRGSTHPSSQPSTHISTTPPLLPRPTSNGNAQAVPPTADPEAVVRDWNRWLVSVQLFTAPLFVVLIIWANSAASVGTTSAGHLLVRLVLYSLLGSLVAFALLLATTTPDKPPRYRSLLCILGFVVSIAWISTIANEVVGVLKALGVILGMSDAILGLTIFAVGSSLGDFVADITVARLGYPVMALSACFGGPMLNILLGIGISGVYMTTKEANHKHAKHPDRPVVYKPFEIEVSGTLMVSAATLLATLLGLLIVVPMNKWMMTRRMGWGLIAVWTASTILNVVIEVTGIWSSVASS